jgi:hypothetical protein
MLLRILSGWLLISVAAVCDAPVRSIHGVVLDSSTRQPIAGAVAVMDGVAVSTSTSGEFQCKTKATAIDVRARGYGRVHLVLEAEMHVGLPPLRVRALYMSFWGVSSQPLRTHVYETAAKAQMNGVVVDVKGDMGLVAFHSAVPMVSQVKANRSITIPDVSGFVADLHRRGLYAIARIVTFKDNPLVLAHPELGIKTAAGALFADRERLRWSDPFKQAVWDYNIQIATEAAKAGFDEIQFDYVRFPDQKGLCFSKENNEKNRRQAISTFLAQARTALDRYNTFLSADCFGYVAWNKDDTGIGQTFEDVGKVVDYISPMLYPSGFRYGIPGLLKPLDDPYRIVHASLERAKERTGFSGLAYRPWLQAFADYAFDHRQFGKSQLRQQIKAAEDSGAEGWLLWNPRNQYQTQDLADLARELWCNKEQLKRP